MATLSSPTLQQLITNVRRMLKQPNRNNSYWSDEELTQYLNDAVAQYYAEVTHHNEGLFTATTTLSITSGSETIALPSDFFEIRGLYRVMSGNRRVPLDFRNRSDEEYSTDGGSGDFFLPSFYLRGNSLVLRPVPNFSESGALVLEYIQFPETMINGGDTLTTQVSPIFKQLIEMYAVWKAKLSETLVNGNNVHSTAESALASLYKTFKETIALRTHQITYTEPFNP